MENRVLLANIKGVIPTSNGCALFLGCSAKIFVIYMEPSMGPIIENAIRETPEERPQSHDLMQLMLDGLGAEVERVSHQSCRPGHLLRPPDSFHGKRNPP